MEFVNPDPPPTDISQAANKKSPKAFASGLYQRRERDSNPRYLSVRRFSRPLQSITLPSLQDLLSGIVVSRLRCKGNAFHSSCKRSGNKMSHFNLNKRFWDEMKRICYFLLVKINKNNLRGAFYFLFCGMFNFFIPINKR